MSKHWEKSSIPYFPVLSDSSTVRDSTLTDPRTSYPEVRYVFLDDPTYGQLESSIADDEEAIVVDLDSKGEEVLGYRSVGELVGIMGVKMKDKEGIKTIEIDVTRSELEGVDKLKAVKDVDGLKKLAELFKERNEQLQKVVE